MEFEAVGVVLAGGRSARMGQSKAIVELAGRPLLAHALESVAEAGLEPLVAAKPHSELPELSSRVILEPRLPEHPLLGVATALRESGGRPAIVLPCDLPFVPPSLLAWLAGEPEPLIVCEGGGRLHPLLGRFEVSLEPELAAAIERGDSAQDTVRALGARVVSEADLSNFGPPQRVLFNVNDANDLAEAERMAAA